jgi:hypothetical protein
MLTQFIADSKTHEVALAWEDAAFTPGSDWALVFTAKRKAADPDSAAIIQKATGAGISATGSYATITLVRADTEDFTATRTLYCGIRATHGITGATRTVWQDKIKFERGIPQETTTTIPVVTTEDPVPFAGSVTLAAVLTALGVPTYADLAAANTALAIGKIYYDTALATLNVTTE